MTYSSPVTHEPAEPTGRIERSEQEWREILSPDQFAVLRQSATESPFAGKYVDEEADGIYRCGACHAVLFDSKTKYHSGSGWPSFYQPVAAEAVELVDDTSHGMVRTEVRCRRCGSHLGHRFDDGPAPTHQRYCMNSVALDLTSRQDG